MTEGQKRALCAVGVFLVLLGVYVITNPGRIDIIDGQYRYDVAKNWLDAGEPYCDDPYIAGALERDPVTGRSYANYGAGASVTPMPLMLLSRALPGHGDERDRFVFTLTSSVFGALGGALLFIGMGMLGVSIKSALASTAVFCFATLWWPGSLTTFDQNQHAVLVLGTALLAWQAGRRSSLGLAALGGAVGGLLVNYHENYALLLPALALPVFASAQEGVPNAAPVLKLEVSHAALLRYVVFGLCCALGIALFFGFNLMRYGLLLKPNRYALESPVFNGNILAGSLSLLFSPGRSVFLFSPPILLLVAGLRPLFRRAPMLVAGIGLASVFHFLFISRLALFGGDWCWGPRYMLIAMLPLALTFPFAFEYLRAKRSLVVATVALGCIVQVFAISIDHQRFFFEHKLAPYFWVYDPWVYFKYSQFIARPAEVVTTLRDGLPPEVIAFAPTDGKSTYTPFGPPDPSWGPLYVRYFSVFYLPRPWHFWIGHVEPALRPVGLLPLVPICMGMILAGCAAVTSSYMGARPKMSPLAQDELT
jgi:hypothetical protein